MAEYKVTYFNVKGLGEAIRYLLSYMGKDFEDNRVQIDQWPTLKKTTPFGKLPNLEHNGKVFHQSSAICRYLAVEAGLAGKTALENLEIDQIVGSIGDLIVEIIRVKRTEDPATKEKLQTTLLNETVPFYMERFEEAIKRNGGYLAVGRLTWADFYLVGYSESLPVILEKPDFVEDYPQLKTLVEKVQSLPGIKEWIKRRPVTPM